MNSNINLKHLLDGIGELRHHADEIYKSLKAQLGEEATFIHEWHDLKRVQMDDPDATELEGDTLIADILVHCFQKEADYIWHYNGLRIRLTPFRSAFANSGFVMYYGDNKHSEITFNSVVETIVEYGESVWEAMAARIYGIADGYLAGLKHNENVVAVKVPDGADGTLACADPCPEEVPVPEPAPAEPVVDQAEEPVHKPKKNIIRAGGGPLPDGNVDMTDSEKAEYLKWKQSVETPQRFG